MRALLLALALASLVPAQSLLFWDGHAHQLVAVPAATRDPAALVQALRDPPAGTRLRTALPPGTTLVAAELVAGRVELTFNSRFLAARALGTLEDAVEQVTKTLNTAGHDHVAIHVRSAGGTLPLRLALGEDRMPPAPSPPGPVPAGAAG